MKTRNVLYALAAAGFVLAIGLACAGAVSTPTAAPTANPPTLAPKPPTLTAPTLSPTENAPFKVGTTLYTHKSGALNFHPPVGWKQSDETVGGVTFESPDSKAILNVEITNTGNQLDAAGYKNFVEAREANKFTSFQNYKPQNTALGSTDNSYTVSKTADLKGVSQSVVSTYYLKGQAVFAFDFWAPASEAESYKTALQPVLKDLTMLPAPVATMPAYVFVTTFTGPKNVFTIDFPVPWTFTEDTSTKDFVIDNLASPDGIALIQSIYYDNGTKIPASGLAQYALTILNNGYGQSGGGVKVTQEKASPGGGEELVWTGRQGGGISGTTLVEQRGTAILMLTTLYGDQFKALYGPVLDTAMTSYKVP